MKQKFILIVYTLFAFIFKSDAQIFSKSEKKRTEILVNQYAHLLANSYMFVQEHSSFMDTLNYYLKNYKEYNFNNGRMEFIICHPILFNSNKSKALILVLQRLNTGDSRLDYVSFINAEISKKGDWNFSYNKKSALIYSYKPNSPTMSDGEITLRALRDIINDKYLIKNSNEIDDSFFLRKNSIYIIDSIDSTR